METQSDHTAPDPDGEKLEAAAALLTQRLAESQPDAESELDASELANLPDADFEARLAALGLEKPWRVSDLESYPVIPETPDEKAKLESEIVSLGGDPRLCQSRTDRKDAIRQLQPDRLASDYAAFTAPTPPEIAIQVKERDARERQEDYNFDNAELYRTVALLRAEDEAKAAREPAAAIDVAPELLSRFPVRTCGELLDSFPNPPAPIIEGIIGEGEKMILGGASKAGKTYCMLNLADAVDSGGKWLGHQCRKGGVLFLNFEVGEARMAERVRRLRASGLAMAGVEFLNLRGAEFDWADLKSTLEYLARRNGYALIILDPIYKLLGDTPENDNTAVAQMLSQIERIAVETKAAVVFAHHFSKGNKSEISSMDRLSGAGAFARDPDAIITLTEHEIPNCFTVEATVRNYATPAPVVVEYNNPRYTVRDELDSARLKTTRRGGQNQKGGAASAVEALKLAGGKLIRRELVTALAEARRATERSARSWVTAAERAGEIVEVQGLLMIPDIEAGGESGKQ